VLFDGVLLERAEGAYIPTLKQSLVDLIQEANNAILCERNLSGRETP
jgi:hypothetical protein